MREGSRNQPQALITEYSFIHKAKGIVRFLLRIFSYSNYLFFYFFPLISPVGFPSIQISSNPTAHMPILLISFQFPSTNHYKYRPLPLLFCIRQTFSEERSSFLELQEFSETKMAGIVVVFDFDKTIIDLDSDNWVVDELGATDLFNELLPTMPWNSLMVVYFFCLCSFFFVFSVVE